MRTIWKQQIGMAERNTIKVPAGSIFLAVQMQRNDLCVWYLTDPTQPMVERTIATFGTGHDIPNSIADEWHYLGTFQVQGGLFIFHAFSDREKLPQDTSIKEVSA